ncbi:MULTISPECIES: TlpA family protein disulfide reductase [Marinobacter]|uniref:TlpA family protein disulfide reductase n=1 Tax=Marinobacter TaxID=2742 RepID=UPI001CC20BA0|nr:MULTISPECIES: TlpA disulfide reductase family protein [Marinobacter]
MQYIQRFIPATLAMASLLVLSGCDRPSFQDAQGQTLDWSSLRGQWVVVNYWAEWCKPCREEIPELNHLDQSPNVTVLGVNFDGITGEPLRSLADKMQIQFRLLAEDPGPALDWKQPVGLPASFIVTPEGKLLEARFGAQSEAGLRALIEGKGASG